MKRILVVEDHVEISRVVIKYLEQEGYQVDLAENGIEALEIFEEQDFQLVLLDVMMPGLNGFEVLQAMRKTSEVPVIIITAKQDESDRLYGFDLGADDYVVKPFSPRELMRRVKAILKRSSPTSDGVDILEYEAIKLYLTAMKLMTEQGEIELTSAEFLLMKTFMEHVGQVLTREQLIQNSFGESYEGFDRNIDSYIKRLRQKVEVDSRHPVYIRTKYGFGYIFGGEET